MSRKITKRIMVGSVPLGGGAPVAVQSMTNTNTADVEATCAQIARLELAGCDIVRVAVPDTDAANAIADIKRRAKIPIVADIHFDHSLAVAAVKAGADKVRINPGNIGAKNGVKAVVNVCRERGVPIRVGVNGGSLEKELLKEYGLTAEALVLSARRQTRLLESFGFYDICVAVKSSSVPLTVQAYRLLSESCDYPLHLGVTEAGTEWAGTIRSAAGIGALLLDGIGDTVRVSLTAEPEREVHAAIELLRAVGAKSGGVRLISCPSCGRCKINLISVAKEVEKRLESFNGRADITVAVMGCAVNGPGEAREADFGLAGGEGYGVLFKRGEVVGRASTEGLAAALIDMIESEIRDER